jgi:hypothetical protein
VTKEVIAAVSSSSGRFLKEDESGWVEVDHEVARLKVSHIFRDLPRDTSKLRSIDGRGAKRVAR